MSTYKQKTSYVCSGLGAFHLKIGGGCLSIDGNGKQPPGSVGCAYIGATEGQWYKVGGFSGEGD